MSCHGVRRGLIKPTLYLFEKGKTMLFAPEEKGQSLIEYAIILSLVAVIVVFVIRMLGPKVGNNYSTISNSVP
jgi:Flp pilus assembly pilin Flp